MLDGGNCDHSERNSLEEAGLLVELLLNSNTMVAPTLI